MIKNFHIWIWQTEVFASVLKWSETEELNLDFISNNSNVVLQ